MTGMGFMPDAAQQPTALPITMAVMGFMSAIAQSRVAI